MMTGSDHRSPLTTALLAASTSPMLVLDSSQQVIAANTSAAGLFALSLPLTDAPPLASLPGGTIVSEWIEAEPPTEWSPDADHAYQPQVIPVEDGGALAGWVIHLHDLGPLRQQARSQSEFIRLIAHDLRSPLTSVQGFASMLDQEIAGPLNERQKHFTQKVLAGIAIITGLVENIQDAGRFDPETGFYEMQRVPCDPGEIAQRIIRNYLMPGEKADLTVQVVVDDNVPIILADQNMVERAVANLIDNAIKYTPNGGSVQVGVQRVGDEVIISVKDTGLGIAEEDLPRLFRRHSRIPRQEFKKIKGTGLGLFIVRSVAQRHQGRVWVESAPGQGSAFFLALPVSAKPA